ncbi:MCP four helix bundle domain-containing protein [Caldalkalibacillus mannanilyticus]|uniref:MCP four helix bundle domain-containing protein n=1 Tax=Caldalkalibacillus mannanilyticus TaxID=1418 RepID=UPI00046AF4E3|nr:MCP four helix bundle domain-containing protein [Caldalkalibacillus mannanilyticus]
MRIKVPISLRLTIGFGLVCAFVVAIGLFSVYTMNKVNQTTQEIVKNWLPSVAQANKIQTIATQFRALEGTYVYNSSTGAHSKVEEEMEAVSTQLQLALQEYVSSSISEQGKKIAQTLEMDFEAYVSEHENIVHFVHSGNVKGAQLIYENETARFFNQLNEHLEKLVEINEREALLAGDTNQQEYEKGWKIIAGAVGAIVLLCILISLWMIRSTLGPIKKINEVVKDLADSREI